MVDTQEGELLEEDTESHLEFIKTLSSGYEVYFYDNEFVALPPEEREKRNGDG